MDRNQQRNSPSWSGTFKLKFVGRDLNLGVLLLTILFLPFGCSATMSAPSMDRWIGKVAVITGASSGIGASVAEHLVENGLKVIGLARRVELIEAHSEKLKNKKGSLHGIKVDVTETKQIIDAFKTIEEKFGPVSILVNDAGVFENTTIIDGDVEKWRKTFETNVIGLSTATREAISSMRRNKIDGHIINMNSIAGHRPVGYVGENVYPASKYAITALTESLRFELLKSGNQIKVTSISPGLVRSTEIFQASGAERDVINEAAAHAALNPEDVSYAIIYALSTPPHVQVQEITLKSIRSEI